MEQLKNIIEEGTKIRDNSIYPTTSDKLNAKIAILQSISNTDSFVMNKKMFDWKKKLSKKEISISESPENIDWLLDPILIFCNEPEETAKLICNKLFEKDFKFIRARNDIFPSRIIIDIEFEPNAYLIPINKSISKHDDNLQLYGAKLNMNGELMLPILLYEYITPKFNYEEWKFNLELEPFLWTNLQDKWVKKGTKPISFSSNPISNKIFNLIKSEDEGSYLFTGNFTYFMMTNQTGEYNGDYHIYHRNPLEFLKKIYEFLPELKIKEETPIYYFQDKYCHLVYNNEHVLSIYNLNFPLNFVRLGLYNHTNYHGLLLFLLIEAFKSPLKDYDDKISNIGYLIKSKNSYSGGHNFNILQNNIIGPKTSPQLEFKIKEWNKELTFFYRPDITEEPETNENESA